MYGHRAGHGPPGHSAGRFMELLEALRAEHDLLQQEYSHLKMQKEEFDSKDLGLVQKIISDLEKNYTKVKQHYEDETKKLRAELEAFGKSSPRGAPSALKFHPLPGLEKEMASVGTAFLNSPMQGGLEGLAGIGKRPLDVGELGRNVRAKASEEEDSGIKSPAGEAEDSSSTGRKEQAGGYEWLVVYNPNVPRSLNVNLNHNFAHEHVVCSVRFSPSGAVLATGSNRMISLYDVKSGERIAAMKDESGLDDDNDMFIRSIAFSPDGALLAAGSEDNTVRLWDVKTRSLIHRFTGHDQDIYAVEFFANGSYIASGSGDRSVKIWDVKKRTCFATLMAGSPDAAKDSGITSIAISPNGKFLAAGSLDKLVRIWELPKGTPVDIIEGHKDSVYSVAFTPDGKYLISGSLDKSLRIWEFVSGEDLKGGKLTRELTGHKDFVLTVMPSVDGKYILSGSKDRSVQCWDVATGQTHLMLQGHKNSVIGIAVSPDGDLFATASGDCRARLWSLQAIDAAPSNCSSGQQSAIAAGSALTSPKVEGASAAADKDTLSDE